MLSLVVVATQSLRAVTNAPFLWTSPILGEDIETSPVIDPENASTLYIACISRLSAIDAATGAVLWTYKDPLTYTGYDSTPVVGPNSTVYVQHNTNNAYLDAVRSGHKLWTFNLGGQESSGIAPALGANGTLLYAISQNLGLLFCINVADGSLAWKLKVPASLTRTCACACTRAHVLSRGCPFRCGGLAVSSR
jgi:outer membrane protein assembly factor BamB